MILLTSIVGLTIIKRLRLGSIGFTLLLLLAACGREDETLINTGREVYRQNCAGCHGPGGEGQVPAAPLQKDETGRFPAPPHNQNGHTWHHSDDLLIQIIKEGGMGGDDFYEMPAFRESLSDDDIEAVLAFIKTLWTEEQRQMQKRVTEQE